MLLGFRQVGLFHFPLYKIVYHIAGAMPKTPTQDVAF